MSSASDTGNSLVRSAAVKVAGVSKTYSVRAGDDVLALDRVDLDITPGSFVAVVGPSGCGKSTLLSLLAGLIPLSTGRLTIDGEEVLKPHPKSGVVFQSDLLLDWRSVLDNVLLPIEIKELNRNSYVVRAQESTGAGWTRGLRRQVSIRVVGRDATASRNLPRPDPGTGTAADG